MQYNVILWLVSPNIPQDKPQSQTSRHSCLHVVYSHGLGCHCSSWIGFIWPRTWNSKWRWLAWCKAPTVLKIKISEHGFLPRHLSRLHITEMFRMIDNLSFHLHVVPSLLSSWTVVLKCNPALVRPMDLDVLVDDKSRYYSWKHSTNVQ